MQNFEYYKTFCAIVENSSISAAAEFLFVSQSAVSQSLKNLEKGLGCKLFDRVSKGVKLTSEGAVLYNYISKGIENIRLGEEKLNDMLNYELGEIKIGASDMTLRFYLLELIEDFRKLYPQIRISVTNAPTPTTINHLKEGLIDFAAVSGPVLVDEYIKIYNVRQIKDIFIAGSKFLPIKDKTLSLEELVDYPLVFLEKNTSTRKYTDAFFSKHGVIPHPDFEISTSDLIVDFVEKNLGIGAIVSNFAERSIKENNVFKVKTEFELPPRDICLLVRTDKGLSYSAKAFLRRAKINDIT